MVSLFSYWKQKIEAEISCESGIVWISGMIEKWDQWDEENVRLNNQKVPEMKQNCQAGAMFRWVRECLWDGQPSAR